VSDRPSDFERLSPAKQKLLLARMEKLRRQQAGGEEPARQGIPRSPLRETGGPFPLSFSQQRLWFIDRMEPENTAYNLPEALRLAGRLDVPVLVQVLSEIVRRHEALRTTFGVVEGKPVQRVTPSAPVAVPLVDLSALSEAAREAEARRLATEEAREPFDVPRGPHLRVRLLRLGESEHAVLFTTHHIVSDGWSMGVLVRELGVLYMAFSEGKPSPLPELPIQYPDFADWQRRRLAGEVFEEHLRFWREALSGAPQVLDLSADRPRPAVQTHRGAAIRTVFPRVETGGNETLFMVLLAAFGAFLARHAGQEDLLVASPVANRTRIETEGLIGFFVNTLTLRVDLRGAVTFRDLLARVRETTLGAYAHQALPFERIVEELQPARDLSRPPLVQVTLALQNAPAGNLELPGLTLAPLEIAAETSQMDLSVEAAETPEGLAASWRFNADLFDEATVRRMAERFRVLLEGIAADPGRPLRDLPLLPDAERDQVLHEWALGPVPVGRERCLHELVFEQAARTPGAPALVFSGETVSYGELAARALALARHLASLGVGPESRVGICLERSPEMVVAALGVLAAGGAYVPLDPAYPQDRLAFMAGDAGLATVVASQATALVLAALAVPVVFVDRETPASDIPLPEVLPDHLAYVIYTSGSTGRPKGVLIPHRGVANTIAAAPRIYGFGPGDRILQFFSFSFDAAVMDVFHTLSEGACLCLARREELLPGEGLEARLREMEITGVVLPPSVLPASAEGFPHLSAVLVGGERCPAESARRWSAGRRFVNLYGPTEVSIFSTFWEVDEGEALPAGGPPIGRPLPGIRAWVVDREGRLAPVGVPGELLLGGVGLARGYHGRPEKTAESFVPDPFSGREGERLYRTGDLVRWRPAGALEILGRIDHQVKLRGHRIEPGEIEASLGAHPDVREAAVLLREGPAGPRLIAYAVPREPGAALPDLRAWLRDRLPEVMIPAGVVPLDALPLTPNGKLDREALPEPDGARRVAPESFAAPRAGLESAIAQVWREVLGVSEVASGDNFFDLGGHSLLLVEAQTRLKERLGEEVSLLDLFRNPNVGSLARFLAGRAAGKAEPEAPVRRKRPAPARSREVAVIGMAGRFPGAPDLAAFWRNLEGGVESISFFSEEELLAAGIPSEVLADPNYVRAGGALEGSDLFDAGFFDVSPREAQILDPQQRVFLECSAEALERAGYGAGSSGLAAVRVGVWAGTGRNDYALRNLAADGVDGFELTLGNDKDFVATRVSYKLDLRGPAMTVQTACSTSLVAIHEACRAIASGECEMALAGGVTLHFPEVSGYLYQEGGIASPDGHNRAFDARAQGTVGGNGVGVVVLKPLEAALADGDFIRAVIKGSALSNDGAGKVGFTAPSEEGEAEAIAEALAVAGVEPGTIGYIEAHGSATPLGDPIEVAALNRVFRGAAPPGSRALGSVKTNVGHTGSAAGVAGFLRAALALEHRVVPPSLHFETPNPRIDFAAGPFRVPAVAEPWPETGSPCRAGVSSFGLGGTNAHAVLEEAPTPEPSGPSRPWQLLSLSARTKTALEAATDRLAAWLEASPEANLADVAFTLHVGRKGFEHRRTLVCRDGEDAREALATRDPRRLLESSVDPAATRSAAFVFSGVGEQYPGMARELYEQEPVFREELDRSAEMLLPLVGEDIRKLLFEEGRKSDLRSFFGRSPEREAGALDRTAVLQPALFAVEYALAKLWMDWGVLPGALLGYSVGEYVAACVAGVLSLEDALRLVAGRARLVAELPPGAMLAVPLPADEVEPILPADLSFAVVNGPRISVVAGPPEAVAAFRSRLESDGHACRALQTTHAFHSAMMAPAAEGLSALAREVTLHPPRIPYLSNVTGAWITPEQATDPDYWAGHLVRTVRFADGVAALWGEPGRVLLEIGPGQSLSALALQHPATEGLSDPVALPSLPGAFERRPEGAFLLDTLGKLWLAGVKVDWPRVYARERRRRVELPPYPFERKRFWLEASPAPRPRSAEILYVPAWRRSMPLPPAEDLTGRWLLFADGDGLAERIAARLEAAGASVAIVAAGERFEGDAPDRIIHFGTFESLLLLVHELAARRPPEELATLRALLVSTPGHPEQGPIAALGQALARELPGLVARSVEVSLPSADWRWDRLAGDLLAELAREAEPWEAPVSLRGAERWVRSFEPVPPREGDLPAGPLLLVGDLPQPLRAAVGAAVVEAPLDGPFPAGDFIGVIVGEIVPAAPLLPLGAVTRTEALASLRTAARRLDALEQALEGKAPGFVLLTSSLDALSARPAHGVLGAVHALVDAFAERERPLPWTSVAWDFESGIDPLEVLRRLLAHGPVARAVATAEDPASRLARSEEAPAGAIALHARPNLRNPYVPPGTDLERAIAEMWQTLLGIEEVGVHDSFFDLGGDSLLATQVVTRVRERFGAEVTLPALFESPTPAGLAGLVETVRPAGGSSEADRLAELMAQLDSLSPEEVERMLAERGE
jgi:amino acid adenylation domain-containing protein